MTLEVSPAGSVTLQQTRWPTVWSSLHTHGQLRYGHPVGQKNKKTKNVIKIKKGGATCASTWGFQTPPSTKIQNSRHPQNVGCKKTSLLHCNYYLFFFKTSILQFLWIFTMIQMDWTQKSERVTPPPAPQPVCVTTTETHCSLSRSLAGWAGLILAALWESAPAK